MSKKGDTRDEEERERRSGHDRSDRSPSNREAKSRTQSQKSRSRRDADSGGGRKAIKLIYKKGHRNVKIVDFVAVSQLIKQHQVTGRVPRSIDLTDYSNATITVFADYIEKGEVKAQISFYALAELLKLTKTFVMEDLQRRLEEILILTAESSTNHLIQAVLVAGTSNVTKETENALHYLASWSFVEMAMLPDFQRIPYHQFVLLLSSCELRVAHELVVADAALLWLVGQPHPAVYAPGVFAVIRSAFLSKVDRQLIIERIATLQMPESVARFARVSMESRHNARICLEGTHISRHLCRCGIPDAENRPKETALSLSRPREGIKWSDKNIEEPKRSESKRSRTMRSKKRNRRRQSTQKKSASNRRNRPRKSPKSPRRRAESDDENTPRKIRRRKKRSETTSRTSDSTKSRSRKRYDGDMGSKRRMKRSESSRSSDDYRRRRRDYDNEKKMPRRSHSGKNTYSSKPSYENITTSLH